MHFNYGQICHSLYHDLQCGFHLIELYKTAKGFGIQYVKTDHLPMHLKPMRWNVLVCVQLYENWPISSYESLLFGNRNHTLIEGRWIYQSNGLCPSARQGKFSLLSLRIIIIHNSFYYIVRTNFGLHGLYTHLTITTTLSVWDYDNSNFPNETTQAQRNQVIYPKSHK